MLEKLPQPSPGKKGWPWTEESDSLTSLQKGGNVWPRISIVTPSYNQGEYIEETIRSVILQNYPNLEYIVIDGGSRDNSVEIINKYQQWITYSISEPDNGQSHAINKGFKKCTGEFVNWICSDDMLCKNALFNLSTLLVDNGGALIIGKGMRIDQNSKFLDEINPSTIHDLRSLVEIKKYWRKYDSVMQQSCFYPLSTIEKNNYLNENNHLTMDYELWGQLLKTGIPVVRSNIGIGIFRWYGGQKTSNFNAVTQSLVKSAISLIMSDRKFSILTKTTLIINVLSYYTIYIYHYIRSEIGLRRRLRKILHVGPGIIYQ